MRTVKMSGVHTFTVLFLVENVPYYLDTRVQREAHVVLQMGGRPIVICPRGSGARRLADGVTVYQYWKPSWGSGFFAHLAEYIVSLLAHTVLAAYVFVRHRFSIIHGANPPDTLWLVAAPYKLLGVRYIFDHHDLVPELFAVRYARRLPWIYPLTLWLERRNIQLADHVVCTNATFRALAIGRGGKSADQVTVVRNGPWLERDFQVSSSDPTIRRLGEIVVGYLGIMNPQDHLENLIETARIVRFERGRTDIGFLLIGGGDSYVSLVEMRNRLGLAKTVEMPGTIAWPEVISMLLATDICVQPDLPTVFNRNLTMNKLMEYMALGKPSIAYDMPETRVTGGDAVMYVQGESAQELADAIISLADDQDRRQQLGSAARRRVETLLSWERQKAALTDVYSALTVSSPRVRASTTDVSR